MKKTSRLLKAVSLLLASALFLGGCGSSGETEKKTDADKKFSEVQSSSLEKQKNAQKNEQKEAVQETVPKSEGIGQLSWTVEEGDVNGRSYVLMNLTNNSEYTIWNVSVTFREKSDITDAQRESFYEYMKQNVKIPEDKLEWERKQGITLQAENLVVLHPGESNGFIPFIYFDLVHSPVQDLGHYELTEPAEARILYLDGTEVKTVSYDFAAEKFTEEDSGPAVAWSEGELGQIVPKPDADIVEKMQDEGDLFAFFAYGVTEEKFAAYAEQCEAAGFTEAVSSRDDFFRAEDASGVSVQIMWDLYTHRMEVGVQKK